MQKYANIVDLVKSFPTSIYLQKSASTQPRTSLSKFGGKFNSLFIRRQTRRAERSWKPLATQAGLCTRNPGKVSLICVVTLSVVSKMVEHTIQTVRSCEKCDSKATHRMYTRNPEQILYAFRSRDVLPRNQSTSCIDWALII